MKCNVDGAVAKVQNRGAVAAICRDSRGVYQGASVVVFDGITNPEVLEAQACAEALNLAADLQVQKVQVTSDCLNVVKGINGEPSRGEHYMILKEISTQRVRFQMAMFSHERREANMEAHRLARTATFEAGRHVWFLSPPAGLNIPVNIMISGQ